MPLLKDNRYRDMECVIHFGDNRKHVMREFQDNETGCGMKVIFNVYKDLDLKIYSELCK